MKGVILAGGTGSRLRPITHTGPKQLVPIANKPVIDYAVEDFVEAGIDDIAIVLGNKGREAIQSHVGDGERFGVDVTYIVQGEPLGIAHAVGCARQFVGDEPFVVYLGDDLMQSGITEMVASFDSGDYDAGIGVQAVDEPYRYGIVDIDNNGDIVKLVEKPDDPPNNLALIGIYIFTPEIFDAIESIEKSWRGEYEITEAIQRALEDGARIQSHIVDGWWKDTGKPKDVLRANRLVLDELVHDISGTIEAEGSLTGRIELDDKSRVTGGAVIRGPVSIGENTTIGPDAYLGPYTSIGDDCHVDNAHIESSVVADNSTITCGRTIVDSLIGEETIIKASDGKYPAGNRLVVGQNSSLEL